jgi:hypothetical protein
MIVILFFIFCVTNAMQKNDEDFIAFDLSEAEILGETDKRKANVTVVATAKKAKPKRQTTQRKKVRPKGTKRRQRQNRIRDRRPNRTEIKNLPGDVTENVAGQKFLSRVDRPRWCFVEGIWTKTENEANIKRLSRQLRKRLTRSKSKKLQARIKRKIRRLPLEWKGRIFEQGRSRLTFRNPHRWMCWKSVPKSNYPECFWRENKTKVAEALMEEIVPFPSFLLLNKKDGRQEGQKAVKPTKKRRKKESNFEERSRWRWSRSKDLNRRAYFQDCLRDVLRRTGANSTGANNTVFLVNDAGGFYRRLFQKKSNVIGNGTLSSRSAGGGSVATALLRQQAWEGIRQCFTQPAPVSAKYDYISAVLLVVVMGALILLPFIPFRNGRIVLLAPKVTSQSHGESLSLVHKWIWACCVLMLILTLWSTVTVMSALPVSREIGDKELRVVASTDAIGAIISIIQRAIVGAINPVPSRDDQAVAEVQWMTDRRNSENWAKAKFPKIDPLPLSSRSFGKHMVISKARAVVDDNRSTAIFDDLEDLTISKRPALRPRASTQKNRSATSDNFVLIGERISNAFEISRYMNLGVLAAKWIACVLLIISSYLLRDAEKSVINSRAHALAFSAWVIVALSVVIPLCFPYSSIVNLPDASKCPMGPGLFNSTCGDARYNSTYALLKFVTEHAIGFSFGIMSLAKGLPLILVLIPIWIRMSKLIIIGMDRRAGQVLYFSSFILSMTLLVFFMMEIIEQAVGLYTFTTAIPLIWLLASVHLTPVSSWNAGFHFIGPYYLSLLWGVIWLMLVTPVGCLVGKSIEASLTDSVADDITGSLWSTIPGTIMIVLTLSVNVMLSNIGIWVFFEYVVNSLKRDEQLVRENKKI